MILIPLAKPMIDDEMKRAAMDALQNERFVLGESVYKFEEEFAKYCGAEFAAATGSGTSALILALVALGVANKNVVTSPASFVASANAIVHAGGKPEFADISSETYTIDPSRVVATVDKNTRAVVPVHLYGFPAKMKELEETCSAMGISIIEDACQAHGAVVNGKRVGSIGDAGCFSFYPSKNMTVAGDGGMVVTNDEVIAETVASLRDSGRARGSKYRHVKLGYTERLNTVQAAIGRVQLRRLDSWNEARRGIADKYNALLSGIEELVIPPKPNDEIQPVYHMYVIRSRRRDELLEWLKQEGIECGVHYPVPIHLQPIYRELFGYKGGEYPESEKLCNEALSIPMFPGLTDSDIKRVAESIREFYKHR